MCKKLTISIVIVVIAVLALAIVVPVFIHAHSTTAAGPPCMEHLRQFDAAKNQWAVEHNKASQDIPTWNDIRPYFPARWSNSIPVCPDGGTYTLGRVGESPTCSLGEKQFGHKLP